MSTISDAIQKTLREELEPTIHEIRTPMDPFASKVVRTSQGVIRNTGLGRGHQVIKTFGVGVAGGAKFMDVGGSNVLTGPNNFNVFDTPDTFPNIDETVTPAFYTANISLIRQLGNFYLPYTIFRTDQYNSSIGSVVSLAMRGLSKLVAKQEINMFYTTDTFRSLGAVGDSSVTITNVVGDTSAVKVDLSGTSAVGRVHRFLQGLMVDIYDSTGVTKRNNDFFLAIDDVDAINDTITIRRLDGQAFQVGTTLNGGITYAGAGGDNDILVIKDSLSKGATGMDTWVKNTGTLFGVDLSIHSDWKSYIPASEGSVLTENILNKRYYKFAEAYPERFVETAVTTMGVLIGLLENLDGYASGSSNDGRFRFDRQGEAMDVDLGFEGFKYRFAGRPVTIHTSTSLTEGLYYGVKLSNQNLKRYVPPDIPGTTSDGRIGQEIEFLGPFLGWNGIFGAAHSGGSVTNFVQAPFLREWNILPDDPVSIKLSGITPVSV